MPEEFFTGTTQAGRTLVLYYEQTSYLTFTDETGEVVHNPAETKIRATLDGAPTTVDAVSWNGDAAAVRIGDLGTFTATSADYAEDHHEALRRYLEHRPSGGWEVEIVDHGREGDELVYIASITNGPPEGYPPRTRVTTKPSMVTPPRRNDHTTDTRRAAVESATWGEKPA
ncbi:MAG: hypothetical protein ACYC1Z_14180 [Georgenia sp.]